MLTRLWDVSHKTAHPNQHRSCNDTLTKSWAVNHRNLVLIINPVSHPLPLQRGNKTKKMNKKSSGSRGNRTPTNKRKSRIITDDGPDINTAATWVDAPATAAIGDEIAAPTTAARATEPLTASKRIKLPDTNKRKAVCLEPTDVLQVKIGRHKGAAYISLRTKAAHNKTVKEAMELQVAGRGATNGSTR